MIMSFKQMEAKRRAAKKKDRPGIKLDHPLFKQHWFAAFGAALSGVLMALSFPPQGSATLIYAAMIPLMFAVHSGSLKRSAWLGLLAGVVFFMVSLGWLANVPAALEGVGMKASALLGYVGLALYCAVYFIPFSLTVTLGVRHWVGSDIMKNTRFMFAVSMVWAGSEYVRGIFLSGFPWNALGVSQYANSSIIQVAEWGGVAVVSAYIVWMNAGLFVTFRQYTHGSRIKKYRPHFELMIGILPVALSVAHGMNVLFNKPELIEHVDVALIQPNIAQSVKWDAALEEKIRASLEQQTLRATSSRFHDVDLVIWPETALPDFYRDPLSIDSRELVARVTSTTGKPLLTGAMDYRMGPGGPVHYNGSMLFDEAGRLVSTYYKQHLVPFGEYVPFPGLMRKFTPIPCDFGAGAESTLFSLPGKPKFSTLICFEDSVAALAATAVRSGARWLVNQTNDAWFDPSGQSEQHLAHAVFRCVENRVPMARCCNTGVSALIDAWGNITRGPDARRAGYLPATVLPREVGMEQTFYTRHGELFAQFALGVGLLALAVLFRNDRKRAAAQPTEPDAS